MAKAVTLKLIKEYSFVNPRYINLDVMSSDIATILEKEKPLAIELGKEEINPLFDVKSQYQEHVEEVTDQVVRILMGINDEVLELIGVEINTLEIYFHISSYFRP